MGLRVGRTDSRATTPSEHPFERQKDGGAAWLRAKLAVLRPLKASAVIAILRPLNTCPKVLLTAQAACIFTGFAGAADTKETASVGEAATAQRINRRMRRLPFVLSASA